MVKRIGSGLDTSQLQRVSVRRLGSGLPPRQQTQQPASFQEPVTSSTQLQQQEQAINEINKERLNLQQQRDAINARIRELEVRGLASEEKGEYYNLQDQLGYLTQKENQLGIIEQRIRSGAVSATGTQAVQFAGQRASDITEQPISEQERIRARTKSRVTETGKEVFIDGQGYSVRDADVSKFIEEETARRPAVKEFDFDRFAADYAATQQSTAEDLPAFKKGTESDINRFIEQAGSPTKEDFIARTATGAVSVPGTIPKSILTGGEFIFARTGILRPLLNLERRVVGSNLLVQKDVTVGVGADLVTFGFFTPAFATTAEIATRVASPTSVVAIGGTQRAGRTTLSKLRFVSERGTVSEQGVIKGITAVIKQGDDISIVATRGLGKTFQRGVQFPTGKEVIKAGRTFAGEDITIIKQIGSKFQTFGGGGVKPSITSTGSVKFVGTSRGFTEKGVTAAGGIAKTEVGDVGSFTITKEIGKQTGKKVTFGGEGTVGSQVAKTVQDQIGGIAKTAVKPQITAPGVDTAVAAGGVATGKRVTVKGSSGKSAQIQEKPQVTVQTPTATVKDIQTTKQISGVSTRQRSTTLTTQQSVQAVAQDTAQITKTEQVIKTQQAPKTKQGITQIERAIQLQKTTTKPFIITPIKPITPTKKPPVIPFGIKRKSITPRARGAFGVQVRRRGKFENIATGLSLKQAQALGTSRVRGTLAATFRITGGRGAIGTPAGFYAAKKSPRTFIERRAFRLSTPTEIGEIKVAKQRKKSKKKKIKRRNKKK